MPEKRVTDEELLAALERHNGNRTAAAAAIGYNVRTFLSRLANIKNKRDVDTPEYSFTPLPLDDVPIEDLIEHRKRQFANKRNHEEASKLIPIRIKLAGPIGLLFFGDPHVDDDGTDIEALERHTQLVADTEGLFAVNVGDTTNNWVGRLARLYGDQSTSAAQAWRLAEWFVGRCDWLWIIGGNHDLWSGAGDPMRWIAKQSDALYKSSEARIALRFPNGREVRVNSRHDHAGSSIWNPAHGPMKAAIMGTRDHLYVAGHKHESAYSVLKDPINNIAMHALKVSSYKVYDRFAKERGFRDNTLSPCALAIINPNLPPEHPDLVKIWWDPEEGADYLRRLRSRGD
jgi:hypothetical protein